MKNIFLLLVLVMCGCRTSRVVSNTTSTDSTTTITKRPVQLEIKPDTARSTIGVHSFTSEFYNAPIGAVLKHKAGKRVGFTITKTSTDDFEVEAVAAGKDTTVMVADTTTRVHTKQVQVREQQPSLLLKLWQGSKNLLLAGLLLLILVLVLLKRFM
jgi:hypothetical protein